MPNEASTNDIALLEMLAEGIDPFTGEVLPNDHLLQHPQIVRALFHAQHAMMRQGKKSQRNPSLPANTGAAWGNPEDEELSREFDAKDAHSRNGAKARPYQRGDYVPLATPWKAVAQEVSYAGS